MSSRRPRGFVTALTLAVMLVSMGARADPPDAGAPAWLAQTPVVQTPSSGSLPIGRMMVLLVVTAGLAGGAWYLRKRRLSAGGGSSNHPLRVVDSTRVGAKAELVIASVNGRLILLGVTEGSIRRLAWIDDEKPVKPGEPEVDGDSFTGMLRSIIGTEGEAAADGLQEHPTAERRIARLAPRQLDPVARTMQQAHDVAPDRVEGQAAGLSNRRSRRTA